MIVVGSLVRGISGVVENHCGPEIVSLLQDVLPREGGVREGRRMTDTISPGTSRVHRGRQNRSRVEDDNGGRPQGSSRSKHPGPRRLWVPTGETQC